MDLRWPASKAPISDWAQFYIEALDFRLVLLKAGTKYPIEDGWNTPTVWIDDAAIAESLWRASPECGMGVVLEPSRLVSLDVDDLKSARLAFQAVSLDLDQLLSEGVRLVGNPAHRKRVFRAPDTVELSHRKLCWPPREPAGKTVTVFELRAGRSVQDALPPSMHPDTGKPYAWKGSFPADGFPDLPTALLELWERWDEFQPALDAACPWSPPPAPKKRAKTTRARRSYLHTDLTNEICKRLSLDELLDEVGATAVGGDRYLCPFHQEENSSFWTFPADEGYPMWICAHGDAPVGYLTNNNQFAGDAIDLFAHRDGLDRTEAIERLAEHFELSPPPVFPLTDLGNAERLIARHGVDLRYCPTRGCWLIWDERRWREDDTGEIRRRAGETVRDIYRGAGQESDEHQRAAQGRHALKSESYRAISAMVSLAETLEGVPVRPDELDADPYLLNAANGTLDLRTGELQIHQRHDLITKAVEIDFDPAAPCEVWLAFLDRIFKGRKRLIRYIQRVIGYTLTGETSERCIFICYGIGANGKSTLLRVIHALAGDYARRAPAEALLKKRGGGIPNDIAALRGGRFVFASESDEGRRLAEAFIKEFTGGEAVTARFLHHEFFTFTPQGKIWLATNSKPEITGTTKAIWDRIRLIPFDEVIPEEEQDKHFFEKLKEELPGILAWAVRGCLAWQKEGLGTSAEVKQATEVYRREMDVLGPFLEEHCEFSETYRVTAKALREAYLGWCTSSCEEPETWRVVAARLKDRGCKMKGGVERAWSGIRLREPS